MTRTGPSVNHVEAWLFDLDNTLYPASVNLFAEMDRRMNAFIADALDVESGQADEIRRGYLYGYGATLRGLMRDHGVNPEAFTAFVHDISLDALGPDPALERALAGLPGRKLVFTNGSVVHAERVMARLGVAHHFEAVFDIAASGYVPKPDPEPYREIVRRHRIAPERALMVDDAARNLAPAASLGMTTLWVRNDSVYGREGADGAHVHHVADDLTAWLADRLAAAR